MSAGEFYPTTGWRTIVGARENDFAAMGRLLARYRPVILKEMQSRVRSGADDAEELTQQFIEAWLRRDFLQNVDQRKGRFRNFIKRCIVNFLRDRHRKQANAPEFQVIGERAFGDGPPLDLPGQSVLLEELIDVEWARHVVTLALAQLERELCDARWGSRFPRLKPVLLNPESDSLEAVAKDLQMTYGAIRTAVFRMRDRFGQIVRDEIRENVGPDDDWQDELRYFLRLLGGNFPVT